MSTPRDEARELVREAVESVMGVGSLYPVDKTALAERMFKEGPPAPVARLLDLVEKGRALEWLEEHEVWAPPAPHHGEWFAKAKTGETGNGKTLLAAINAAREAMEGEG